MFKKYRARKAQEKAAADKILADDYLLKLSNSVSGICGLRHSGSGCDNTLSIDQVQGILHRELKRLTAK